MGISGEEEARNKRPYQKIITTLWRKEGGKEERKEGRKEENKHTHTLFFLARDEGESVLQSAKSRYEMWEILLGSEESPASIFDAKS